MTFPFRDSIPIAPFLRAQARADADTADADAADDLIISPAPGWLDHARRSIAGEIRQRVGHYDYPSFAESAVTLYRLLASLEFDGLPAPDISAIPDGGLAARWEGLRDAVAVAATGRSAAVSAWRGISPYTAAFHHRDATGRDVPGAGSWEGGPGPTEDVDRLRVAISWLLGIRGVSEAEMLRDAACGRKRI